MAESIKKNPLTGVLGQLALKQEAGQAQVSGTLTNQAIWQLAGTCLYDHPVPIAVEQQYEPGTSELFEQIELLKKEIEKLKEQKVEHSQNNVKEIDNWLEKDYSNTQIENSQLKDGNK